MLIYPYIGFQDVVYIFNYLRFIYIILIFGTWSEVYVLFLYILFLECSYSTSSPSMSLGTVLTYCSR